MARTAATATGTFVGVCVKCDARFFAASDADRGYRCTCPGADELCDKPFCLMVQDGPHSHFTIKWSAVKGRVSPKHVCDAACLTAQGDKCTCSCGGRNHGYGLARFEQGLAPRAA